MEGDVVNEFVVLEYDSTSTWFSEDCGCVVGCVSCGVVSDAEDKDVAS